MTILFKRIIIALIMSLFFLSSCTGTKLINEWKDSSYERRYLQNALVVGISDLFDKRKLEDVFARNFQENGVKAVTFASIYQKKKATRDDIRAEAAKLNNDAIFIVRLISMSDEEVRERIAPPPQISPDWSYSFPIYTLDTRPTEYDIQKKHIVLECSLYDTSNGKLIWRVRSETIKPGSTIDVIDSISRAVMKNLHHDKLIR
ncbi:MAG TPA: hypothetical protein VLX29_06765 [Nitrospirota bacterium]|nr:hypothetical protein [Nitrospirota bacterium]